MSIMSNRHRHQRVGEHLTSHHASVPRPKITASEKLRTLDLYLSSGNSNIVGDQLGISGSAVRDRLYAMGVRLLDVGDRKSSPTTVNDPQFLVDLKRRLRVEIRQEEQTRLREVIKVARSRADK